MAKDAEEIQVKENKQDADLKKDIKDQQDSNETKQPDRVQELETEKSELIDLLKRKQAEFENYRKRIEKEQSEYAKHATDRLVTDLLEVLDNFNLSLKHGVDEVGVKMIYEQFTSKLNKIGIIEYSMIGKQFDPNLCEALMTQSVSDKEEGIVIDEIAKGYMVHDKVLRCAKVIINKKQIEEHENKK